MNLGGLYPEGVDPLRKILGAERRRLGEGFALEVMLQGRVAGTAEQRLGETDHIARQAGVGRRPIATEPADHAVIPRAHHEIPDGGPP